jgi:predicted DNA-binding antitoxin AbrB/MazE fold protein
LPILNYHARPGKAGAAGRERRRDRVWGVAGIGDAGIQGLFSKVVNGIYERGVLRPLKPLPLAESQRVSVTIFDSTTPRSLTDPDLSEDFMAEREER